MALPGTIEQNAAAIEAARRKDLKSVVFRWKIPVSGNSGLPLTVVGSFNPEESYMLCGIRYVMAPQLQGSENALIVGFSDNPATYSQVGSVGTSILDTVETFVGTGYLNFVPRGFYLPIGKKIYVLVATSMAYKLVYRGTVQLYLSQTWE